jgi:hypothetical protein
MVDITESPTAAISGGDFAGGFTKEGAFNNVIAPVAGDAWVSVQTNISVPNVADAAYIGVDLGEGITATVDSISIVQHSATGNNSVIGSNSWDFEYSQNGSDWTLHEQLSPTVASIGSTLELLTLSATSPAARFFRLNPNANPPGPAGSALMVQESVAGGGGGGGGTGISLARSRRRRGARWRD